MSGNEEADAAAGTPDEGKKLTFAERRELERRQVGRQVVGPVGGGAAEAAQRVRVDGLDAVSK